MKILKFITTITTIFFLSNCSSMKVLYVNDVNPDRNNLAVKTPTLDLEAVNGELTIEITDDILEGTSVYKRTLVFESGEDPDAAIYKAVDGKKVDGIFVTRWVQEEDSSIFGLSSVVTSKVKGKGIKIKYMGIEKTKESISNQIFVINSQIDFKNKQITLLKKYLSEGQKVGTKDAVNLDLKINADRR